jgi:hypothetical protein
MRVCDAEVTQRTTLECPRVERSSRKSLSRSMIENVPVQPGEPRRNPNSLQQLGATGEHVAVEPLLRTGRNGRRRPSNPRPSIRHARELCRAVHDQRQLPCFGLLTNIDPSKRRRDPRYRLSRLMVSLDPQEGRIGMADYSWVTPQPRPIRGLDLVLLDAGLYSSASKRQPSGGSIGAIVRPCIEGNRRAWGSLTNSVDDDFE